MMKKQNTPAEFPASKRSADRTQETFETTDFSINATGRKHRRSDDSDVPGRVANKRRRTTEQADPFMSSASQYPTEEFFSSEPEVYHDALESGSDFSQETMDIDEAFELAKAYNETKAFDHAETQEQSAYFDVATNFDEYETDFFEQEEAEEEEEEPIIIIEDPVSKRSSQPTKPIKKKSKTRKIILTGFLAVLSVFCMVVAVFLGSYCAKMDIATTLDEDALGALDVPPENGTINLLMVGVDEDGTRSDTIILVSVDNIDKEVKLLSIPRDTQITYNDHPTKINSCVGREDGDKLLINTVHEITGIPIHYYCKIGFDGFIEVIDALGGVDYNVPMDMDYDDPAQDLHIHLKAGMQHLDGKAAHDLMRFRKGYNTGDLGRIGTQQDFLMELFHQKMTADNLSKVPDLIDVASKHVRTNFNVTSAMGFASMLKTAETTELETFLLPGTDGYENDISYYFYDPVKTKELVLEEFGYPEGEAAKKAKQNANQTTKPSASATVSTSPSASSTAATTPKTFID